MYPEGDRPDRRFEQIIGKSAALESVLEQVEQVASTNSTVLIEGETGTGKELIAHAIHNASQRCGRAFIKLNCAAIPLDLLESELFGHEKGAFTGAIAQKIGRFEMADKGTLFLDEVGDIPPRCSRSCCACCKNRSSSDSAAVARTKWMSGWWRQPIGI
jgi:transcriptional regulator with GAF, ATPase, and Fis domain